MKKTPGKNAFQQCQSSHFLVGFSFHYDSENFKLTAAKKGAIIFKVTALTYTQFCLERIVMKEQRAGLEELATYDARNTC